MNDCDQLLDAIVAANALRTTRLRTAKRMIELIWYLQWFNVASIIVSTITIMLRVHFTDYDRVAIITLAVVVNALTSLCWYLQYMNICKFISLAEQKIVFAIETVWVMMGMIYWMMLPALFVALLIEHHDAYVVGAATCYAMILLTNAYLVTVIDGIHQTVWKMMHF